MAKPRPGPWFCAPYFQPDPSGPSASRFGQLLPNRNAGAWFCLAYDFFHAGQGFSRFGKLIVCSTALFCRGPAFVEIVPGAGNWVMLVAVF